MTQSSSPNTRQHPSTDSQDSAPTSTVAIASDGRPVESLPPVRLFEAESLEEQVTVVDERTWLTRAVAGIGRGFQWLFGMASLVAGLALLATLPIAQFLSLGYLLEASGRIARTRKFRSGFIGIAKAGQIGSIVMGTWLMLLPLWVIADFADAAELIDPGSDVARGWRVALVTVTVLMVVHILSVWACGGRLRQFFWPLLAPFSLGVWVFRRFFSPILRANQKQGKRHSFVRRLLADIGRVPPLSNWFVPLIVWRQLRQGRTYVRSRDAVWEFIVSLRLPYYFWLGVRGFCGAVAWLFFPAVLLIGSVNLQPPLGVFSGLAGSFSLAVVLLYLPFLQAHFAAEGRLSAMFELVEIRNKFRRAPIAFWFALLTTLLFALPLYFLTVEYTPREIAFLPGIIFVAFIWPARMFAGWALARSERRERPRHFLFRWSARLLAVPVVLYYVLMIFLMQYLHWHGEFVHFEQHAFLVPAPFLGL